jgi:uncharacterized RDD family membrane protein YckC
MFDIILISFVPEGIYLYLSPENFERASGVIITMVAIVFYVFVETILLSLWGTTPGKSFFKIKLQKSDGTPIRIGEAFLRCLRVSWRGLAFGIPLISLITLMRAWVRLSEEGITSWDSDGGFTVVHERIGRVRLTLIVVFVVAFFGLSILDYFI